MQYKLNFSEEEISLVLQALSQLPYNAVGVLIDKIVSEGDAQKEAKKETESAK